MRLAVGILMLQLLGSQLSKMGVLAIYRQTDRPASSAGGGGYVDALERMRMVLFPPNRVLPTAQPSAARSARSGRSAAAAAAGDAAEQRERDTLLSRTVRATIQEAVANANDDPVTAGVAQNLQRSQLPLLARMLKSKGQIAQKLKQAQTRGRVAPMPMPTPMPPPPTQAIQYFIEHAVRDMLAKAGLHSVRYSQRLDDRADGLPSYDIPGVDEDICRDVYTTRFEVPSDAYSVLATNLANLALVSRDVLGDVRTARVNGRRPPPSVLYPHVLRALEILGAAMRTMGSSLKKHLESDLHPELKVNISLPPKPHPNADGFDAHALAWVDEEDDDDVVVDGEDDEDEDADADAKELRMFTFNSALDPGVPQYNYDNTQFSRTTPSKNYRTSFACVTPFGARSFPMDDVGRDYVQVLQLLVQTVIGVKQGCCCPDATPDSFRRVGSQMALDQRYPPDHQQPLGVNGYGYVHYGVSAIPTDFANGDAISRLAAQSKTRGRPLKLTVSFGTPNKSYIDDANSVDAAVLGIFDSVECDWPPTLPVFVADAP